jgi:16S rRNA (guanine966-N2)-methyltransferase
MKYKFKQNPRLAPRIIAGRFKGLRLNVPNSARPFTDRVKQSVFDSLQQHVIGAQVLDLFAGSGNLGIEALSRGAAKATFVDVAEEAIENIKHNLSKLNIAEDSVAVFQQPAGTFLQKSKQRYDLIFLDPPFALAERLSLQYLPKVMHDDSVAVLKMPKDAHRKEELDISNLNLAYQEELGQNVILYLQKEA